MHNLTPKTAGLLLALTLAAGCGDDTILAPTLETGCVRGSLGLGTVVQGSLNEDSCRDDFHLWTWAVAPYEIWRVELTAGQGYMFHLDHGPDPAYGDRDEVDPVLLLYERDEHGYLRPLGLSDQEGGNDGNADLYFVAPRSGSFLVMAAAKSAEFLGGYRLSLDACPVLGVLDTIGTYTFDHPTSGCIRRVYNTEYEYVLMHVAADPQETFSFGIQSAGFDPYAEAWGLGFDAYSHLYPDGTTLSFYEGLDATMSLGEKGGQVTVAVGRPIGEAPGASFSLQFGRTAAATPQAAARSRAR